MQLDSIMRDWRKRRGLTQTAAGVMLGVHKRTIVRCESNGEMSTSIRKSLAAELWLEAEELRHKASGLDAAAIRLARET